MRSSIAAVSSWSAIGRLLLLEVVHDDDSTGQAAVDQGAAVCLAICDQADRASAIATCAGAVWPVEMRPIRQHQDGTGSTPHVTLEHSRLGASERQRDSVSVAGHTCQPCLGMPTERWVAPHTAMPFRRQPVFRQFDVPGSGRPRTRRWRSARVQVERAECRDDLLRCQPRVSGCLRSSSIWVRGAHLPTARLSMTASASTSASIASVLFNSFACQRRNTSRTGPRSTSCAGWHGPGPSSQNFPQRSHSTS